MRVMRFTADDMTQALRQVREALGPGAVILSTSRTPAGGVEISAAADQAQPGSPAARAQAAPAAEPTAQAPVSSQALAALARRVEGLGELVARHLVASEAALNFAARPEVAPLYQHLAAQEVAPAVILELLSDMESANGQGLLPRLAIRLKKMVNVAPANPQAKKGPSVWALVGPTGVGKTTTVAKLAATFALQRGLKVGLITVDTYRVAAAEQIKVYGQIMDLPTVAAADAAELKAALETMAGLDVVLVDTVGRSPKDDRSLKELKEMLAGVENLSTHLVLACPTRDADQAEILASFACLEPRSLIFTKLDETATYGPILNQSKRSGLPVSYLTNGQRVPDDLMPASRDGLARLLMPSRDCSAPGLSQGVNPWTKPNP